MADFPETTDLIYKDWIAYIGTVSPYVFGNDDAKLDEGDTPWYRVSFREVGGGRANLNGRPDTRRYERLGFLSVQCFDQVNKGDKAGFTMAEAARRYFEDRRLNNDIIYLNAVVRPQVPDGKWRPVLMEAEVEFTEFK